MSFNEAFKRKGMPLTACRNKLSLCSITYLKYMHGSAGLEHHVWDVDLYGELLEIGGGKERMTKYFKVSPGSCQGKHQQLLMADLIGRCSVNGL